jgi:hypothetical protein
MILTALLATLCAGCASPDLKESANEEPAIDLVAYFTGNSKAWGQFQDRFGKVRRRFVVDITGDWDGETLTLTEAFRYADGAVEQRVWQLQRTGATTWTGTANGVVGTATGEVSGNAFNWRYTFDLQTGDGKTLRLKFDDWMWRQDEHVIINRASVSKFGITVGEVLIFFQREGTPVLASGTAAVTP